MILKCIPKQDIPQVLDIYRQGVDAGRSTFNTEVPTAEQWDASHLESARVGAYEDDLLLGWAALSPTSARACYKGVCEVSLYIREGYRDSGLGTTIMKELIRQAEANGVWSLYASIFSTKKASIRMCEKAGWRIVGTRQNIAKDKFGVWQSTTIMEYRSQTVGID